MIDALKSSIHALEDRHQTRRLCNALQKQINMCLCFASNANIVKYSRFNSGDGNMRKRLISALLPLTLCPIGCLAAAAAEKASWIGYLVDQENAVKHHADKSVDEFLRKYDRGEALKAPEKTAAYQLYSNGEWLALDKKGNQLARQHIQQAVKSQSFHVLVKGKQEGKQIKVLSMSDISDTPREPRKDEPQ